ncbi:rhodanese-like domain-containing protein [Desulforhopalus sp. 52FAK]
MATFFKNILFLLLILLLCGFFWQKYDWTSINSQIDKLYPSIDSITTDSLYNQLKIEQEISIIDVRPKEEYRISHLPGAINITDIKNINVPRDSTIVVYCSVGLRSAGFAKDLQKEGYTAVLNLRGSIFEWANKGYPLKRGEQDVTVVHPYNKKWGRLLDESLHAYEVD